MANYKYEYVKLDYEVNDQVMFPNLIVVRIHLGNFTIFSQVLEFEQPNDENALNLMNACATVVLKEYPDIVFSYGFHDEYSFVFSKDTNFYQRRARFSEMHEFEKPNDEQALNLMNTCAVAVLKEFNDIVFSYGVSDEYSFVLKEDCQRYQRRASYIVSAIVSLFSSVYVMQWINIFPNKELKYTPCFDGRAVCHPSSKILQDYLAWRQVTSTTSIILVFAFLGVGQIRKDRRTKREAQIYLKGTQTNEKYHLLAQQFNIDYDRLPIMFRRGSSVFREQTRTADV